MSNDIYSVRSAAQLDALPEDSVIRIADGVHQVDNKHRWFEPGLDVSYSSAEIFARAYRIPIVVLWNSEEESGSE